MKRSWTFPVELPPSHLRPPPVSALSALGYVKDRQRGSHIVLRQSAYPHRRLTIPDHRELAKGTLRAILRQAGISVEQLIELLR